VFDFNIHANILLHILTKFNKLIAKMEISDNLNAKIPNIKEKIASMLEMHKQRKFVESIEFMFLVKNFDIYREKRFCVSVVLPHARKFRNYICLIGDAGHLEEAKEEKLEIDCADLVFLENFKRDKHKIAKWGRKYDYLMMSENIIRKLVRITGPVLLKIRRFPLLASSGKSLKSQIEAYNKTAKFFMRREPNISDVIGNVTLTPLQIEENLRIAIKTVISVLPKGWGNIQSMHIKTTMGKPIKLYYFLHDYVIKFIFLDLGRYA